MPVPSHRPRHFPVDLLDRGDEGEQLLRVELTTRPDAGAQVDTIGANLPDRFRHVSGGQAPGKKHRLLGRTDESGADRPVMRAAGSAQLSDRGVGPAGVEQEGMNARLIGRDQL